MIGINQNYTLLNNNHQSVTVWCDTFLFPQTLPCILLSYPGCFEGKAKENETYLIRSMCQALCSVISIEPRQHMFSLSHKKKLFLSLNEICLPCGKSVILGDLFKGVRWHKIIAPLLNARHDARFQELIFRSSVFSKMERSNHNTGECSGERQRRERIFSA